MRLSRRRQQQFLGLLIGLAVTVAAALLFYGDFPLKGPEQWAFDLRMRNTNDLLPTTPIVHVDVDDGAVERVGRWPWPRRKIAELIRAIADLEPAYIMVDFLFSEPEQPIIDDPRLDEGVFDSSMKTLGTLSEANVIRGDHELAHAIDEAGNVILAAQFDARAPGQPPTLEEALQRRWAAQPDARDPDSLRRRLHLPDTPEVRRRLEREVLRLRMADLLRRNFTLTEQDLSERLDCPLGEVSTIIAGVKDLVAQRRVAALFSDCAEPPDRDTVLTAILGDQKKRRNADRRDVIRAYHTQMGLRALVRSLPSMRIATEERLYHAPNAVPPLAEFTRAALGLAAVNFTADDDGVVRRVPLIMAYADRVAPHLGLAAACRILGLDVSGATLSPDGRWLTIPSADGVGCRLPLDGNGNLIIHWTRTAPQWRQGRDFPHISAGRLMSIVDAKEKIATNEIAIQYHLADVIAAAKGQFTIQSPQAPGGDPAQQAASSPTTAHADHVYRRKVNRLVEIERLLHGGAEPTANETAALKHEADALRSEIEREQKTAVGAVEMFCRELDEIPADEIAADPELAADAARYRSAKQLIDRDIPALRRANDAMRETIARQRAELSSLIKDKYVFLGFAATAQGDIVVTPIDSRTNGVMCHAHVLNTLLQSRPIRVASAIPNLLIVLGLGAAISLLTATFSPRPALLATIAILVGYGGVNANGLFMRMDVWVDLAPTTITGFVAWAFVTLFRQLTAEREKRLFARELGQYTSPAIAARIAESPEASRAFKTVQTREMTCMFTDLAGFTTLTEEKDPELIQHVLNTYLERMSRAIWAQRGLINKFMGDGIMAFYNPSVDPLEDHARAACETALSLFEELDRLKADRRDDPAADIFDALSMRIGLSTGVCKNGDMGSTLKADYTVIGDVVNLAARLEPANKVFGTKIMLGGPTRDQVADRYEFRYLAELQVKGKARTVPVFELICRKGELTDDQREYVRRFEAGVELYKQRKWDECIVHFTRLLSRRIDDAGASRYVDACQELKQFPPDEHWSGALELKEK